MNAQEISNIAAMLSRFVIENGRVEGEGQDWLDSLAVEVEFEANERGLENAKEMAAEAVRLQS